MTKSAQVLLEAVLELPQTDRADFVGRLLESLPVPPASPSVPADEQHWFADLERRASEMDRGEVGVPWPEVRRSIEGRLRRG